MNTFVRKSVCIVTQKEMEKKKSPKRLQKACFKVKCVHVSLKPNILLRCWFDQLPLKKQLHGDKHFLTFKICKTHLSGWD